MNRSFVISVGVGTLFIAAAIGSCGCATGTSALAASTYGKAFVYRSATVYVQLPPERAFNPAVEMLLERGDIEITELDEADNRCAAVSGNHTITLRVIESGDGRSRISILVGGGDDPNASRDLADDLIWRICARLRTECDFGAGGS